MTIEIKLESLLKQKYPLSLSQVNNNVRMFRTFVKRCGPAFIISSSQFALSSASTAENSEARKALIHSLPDETDDQIRLHAFPCRHGISKIKSNTIDPNIADYNSHGISFIEWQTFNKATISHFDYRSNLESFKIECLYYLFCRKITFGQVIECQWQANLRHRCI